MAEMAEQARTKDIINYTEFKYHLGPILMDSKMVGVFIQIFVIDDHLPTLNSQLVWW